MRLSNDEIIDGYVYNGFDYEKQCWIIKGVIQDCSHPNDMECDCYGRKNKNKLIKVVK